jgi:hypothetical protein
MRSWDGLSQDSIVLTYCHLPETCDLWNQEESGKTLITSVAKKNDGHGKGYPVSQSTNLGRWSVCARLWHVCYSLWSTVTSHRSFDHTRLADLHKNRSWTYVFLLVSPDLVIKIRVWGVADIGHLVRVIANLVINKYYRHLNLKTEYRKSTSQSSHFPKQNGSLDLFGPINIRVLSPVYSHEHSGSFFHNYLTIMSEKKTHWHPMIWKVDNPPPHHWPIHHRGQNGAPRHCGNCGCRGTGVAGQVQRWDRYENNGKLSLQTVMSHLV